MIIASGDVHTGHPRFTAACRAMPLKTLTAATDAVASWLEEVAELLSRIDADGTRLLVSLLSHD